MTQLETLFQVVRKGSLRKAAEVMHLSQPALSKQIRALEVSLGCPLFQRSSSRKMLLTEEGLRVLKYAEDIFAKRRELIEDLENFKDGSGGRVVLSSGSATLALMLPGKVMEFRRRYPDCRLFLREHTADIGFEDLAGGRVDITVALSSQVPPQFDCIEWRRAHYRLMLPRGHKLAGRQDVSLEEIASNPIIKLASYVRFASGTRLEEAFAERGLTPDVFLEGRNIYVMAEYVRRGCGVSVITSLCDPPEIFAGELDYAPLDHIFPPEMVVLCFRRNGGLTPAAKRLVDVIMEDGADQLY